MTAAPMRVANMNSTHDAAAAIPRPSSIKWAELFAVVPGKVTLRSRSAVAAFPICKSPNVPRSLLVEIRGHKRRPPFGRRPAYAHASTKTFEARAPTGAEYCCVAVCSTIKRNTMNKFVID